MIKPGNEVNNRNLWKKENRTFKVWRDRPSGLIPCRNVCLHYKIPWVIRFIDTINIKAIHNETLMDSTPHTWLGPYLSSNLLGLKVTIIIESIIS